MLALEERGLSLADRNVGVVSQFLRLLHQALCRLPHRPRSHPDWRARDAAIEKIMRVHGKYIERLDLSGTLDHTGAIAHLHQVMLPPADDLNPDQRRLMRELLTSYRATTPKSLPPAVLKGSEPQDDDETTTS